MNEDEINESIKKIVENSKKVLQILGKNTNEDKEGE